jgi:tetratricopeptide (TPR) repeat protein
MSPRKRKVATSVLATLALCLLVAAGTLATPALAQSDPAQPQAQSDADNKKQAKEERIQEYLRKREERRAEKDMNRKAREARKVEDDAREIEKQQLADRQRVEDDARKVAAATAEADRTAAAAAAGSGDDKKKKKRSSASGATRTARLPKNLERAQANIRTTELALDPTVIEYLDLIDRQGASAHQLAAFGSFIAQNGMMRDALAYYDVALRLAGNDSVLWINAGTLYLQTKHFDRAAASFARALNLDPSNATAHYNLGATYDEMDKYKDAIEAYKTALALDPSLGDPARNPAAANNDLLIAVKLMLYQEQVGSLSLPLIDVVGPESYGIPPATE